MSKQIDERVVSMQFDNRQFEHNVATSMSTLDKLKQKLNLNGAAQGLENVNAAAKKTDMSGLSNGIETVRAKFSALEVMGVTALANITNSAVNAGKRMVSALTIEPIKAGFQEYETQMNAVQTILANTQKEGTNVKTVNKALDELNTYADKTIYNFTEMTRNIGTFTAAGVKLDTSVSSIKGIANLAAVSGSSSQQASTAMYQLSQAIASGTVKLMDWNSVVNAGMGGQVFQDALIRTSEHLKTGAKGAIAAEGSFRESLKTGWLTTEVLTQTLDQFATAADTQEEYEAAVKKFVDQGYSQEQAKQMADMAKTAGEAATKVKTFTQLIDTLKEALGSGWTTSWRLIIGDFEEAKELWTDVSDYFSDAINKSSEARNKMLEGWAEGGGRAKMIESFKNAFNGLLNIIKPIKEAFREVFPPTTSEQLLKITERIRDLTAKFRELTEKNAPKLKSTFKGIFSVFKIGVTVVKAIVGGISQLIGKFTGLSGGILGITGSLGEWVSGVAKSITETNLFGKAINTMVGFLGKAVDKLKEFGSYIKGKFKAPGFEAFLNILKTIGNAIKKVGMAVVKVASSIGKALGNAFRNGDMKSLLDLVNGGIVTGILLNLKKWIKGFKNFADSGKGIIDTIKEIFGTVGDSLKAWQQNIKAGTIKKIAISIGILAASLWVLSRIDSEKLGTALGAITGLFVELIASMKAFDKLDINAKGTGKAAVMMIGMSVAVLILASAVKKIANLDLKSLAKGVAGIGILLAEIVGAAKLMSIGGKNISKGATQMILMAVALKIMASVCKDLSTLSWEGLAKGVSGIGGILAVFAGFAELMKLIKPKKMLSSALSLVLIGAAMEIFANVCAKFGQMKWGSLGKTGAAIAGILVLAAGFAKLSSYAGKMVRSSVSLILIGAAMEIFADVCNKFGQMKWESLGKAGAAIAGILILAAGFTLLSGLSSKMLSSVISLTIMAAAMEIFADVCNKFGQMKWESLAKAGVAIGGILALAAGFALLSGLASGILKSSAALLIMAAALVVLTPILKSLGNMSWGQIAKGLIAIAGAFAIIGVAGLVLGPIVPSIIALAAAVALLGAGCLAAGVGIMAFAAGMATLAGVTAAGATAIVAALHIIIVGILELIPAIIDSLTNAVVALCEVFIRSVPAICEAVRVLIVELVQVLVECVPVLAEGALQLVVGVLDALVRYTPQIVDLIFDFLIAILEGIARKLPALIQAVVNVFKALFSGVIDALKSIDPELLAKGILGIGLMSAMMTALAAMALLAPAAMVGVIGFGVVITELAGVLAVLGGLAQIPGLEWLISEGGAFLQKIGVAIGQFIGGIIGGIAVGATSTLPQIGTNLSEFMANIKPFIEGAKMIDSSTFDGVKALTEIILALTGANILEGLTAWFTGGSSLTKFGEEIAAFAPNIKYYADTVKGIDAAAVEASVNAAKCLSELADNLPNSGGVVGFFAGDNDIGTFGEQLITFGEGMKSYSDSIVGFNAEAVIASANAAQAIADMTSHIPNQGGMVAWFAGDNSVANFAFDLVKLGEGLKSYSDAISGFNAEAVTASANAAQALADMTSHIPNQGGMVAWFTGDNSVANFAFDLVKLGNGLKSYSDTIVGFNAEAVTASANAAKALADMTACIPNQGGMVAWFTGDNSVARFSLELIMLGQGLVGFSNSVAGINVESVTAAAGAAKALADMASCIPNEGGMVAWFTGDNSVARFSTYLAPLGEGLASFSNSVAGINAENIMSAASAAKAIAEMTATIPNEGGLIAWFTGEASIANFADRLPLLGAGLLSFSNSVSGINAESMVAASNAAQALADMTSHIPNQGGMVAWFTGESSIANFADKLPLLGNGLKGFSDAIAGINAENITAAASAAKALAEMTAVIPNEGGIKAWFTGETSIANFASKLPTLGDGLKGFSDSVAGIVPENVTAAANAAKKLGEMMSVLPKNVDKIESFGNKLEKFGEKLSAYFSKTSGISSDSISASNEATKAITDFSAKVDPSKMESASEAIKKMADALKDASKVKGGSTDGFSKALSNIAKNSADAIINSFKDMHSKVTTAGKTLMDKFIDGIEDKKSAVEKACESIADTCVDALEGTSKDFETAGKNVVKGFASGIDNNSSIASRAASSMAKAAYNAAKKMLDINSPSKVFRRMAYSIPEGFAQGIDRRSWMAEDSAVSMAKSALNGTKNAISKIADAINSDIDTQPTIRPVVDMSDVTDSANSINGLFSMKPSVGVLSNVRAISSMMNENQNGDNSDVISAIKDLGHKIENSSGNTYNVNGVTYDDGTNVSNAIGELVRAVKIERRT